MLGPGCKEDLGLSIDGVVSLGLETWANAEHWRDCFKTRQGQRDCSLTPFGALVTPLKINDFYQSPEQSDGTAVQFRKS
jgi:hypothetical protein